MLILRPQAAIARSALKRTAFYAQIQRGTLPAPFSLGERATGFIAEEIDAVLAARAAGASDAEVRELVEAMQQQRKARAAELVQGVRKAVK